MKKACLTGVALIACLLGSSQLRAVEEKEAMYEHCAKVCHDCERACDGCANHCAHLLAEGKKEHLRTLRSCQDCATHCSAAACITARKGLYSDTICKAC